MARGPQRDFTKGSIPRHIVLFSLPMFAGNLLQMLYNVVDSIWVGQFVGPEALGAVSVTMPLIFALLALVMGLTMATTTLVAQFRGSGNEEKVQQTIGTSLVILGIGGILVAIVGGLLRYPLLRMMATPAEIIDQSASYLGIFMAGILGLFLFNTLGAILRGLGDAQTPLISLAVATVLNIILDGVFVVGVGPIPKMGVPGAALATIISQGISAIWLLRHILKKTDLIRLDRAYWQIDRDVTRSIFKIGLPAGMQQTLVAFGAVAVTALINQYGPSVVAAFGAAQRLDQVAFLPTMTMGLAVSSIVGQNLGAKQVDRVGATVRWSSLLGATITGLVSLLAFFKPTILMVLFTSDPTVLTEGANYLRYSAFSYVPFALLFILGGVMRGAGDTMPAMFFTLIALWIVRIPLAYYLSGIMGTSGIWLSIVISSMVALALHWLYYLTGRWKRKAVGDLKETLPDPATTEG